MSKRPNDSQALASASEDLVKRLKAAANDAELLHEQITSTMSKRPHDPQASASASEDLIKRLTAAANDVGLVREIVGSSDNASNSAAFIALLAGNSSSAVNGSELRNKTHKRPCPSLPAETFLEVVLFADRDTLDTMQLVCSFLLKFIRERELTQLALRDIWDVRIGKYEDESDDYEGWQPTIEMGYYRDDGKELAPNTVRQLTSCLRTAFCGSVRIDPSAITATDAAFDEFWRNLFRELVAPSTFVRDLRMDLPLCSVELALRGIVAFKAVECLSVVSMDSFETYANEKPLDESFFGPAAERGVRDIVLSSAAFRAGGREPTANTAAALSFGFAEPTTGGERSLAGFDCGIGADFLAQVKQKANELNEDRHVDFAFKIISRVPPHIDSTAFEKYQSDNRRTWLMNDLENHVNVEVKRIADRGIEIHVFSSV